VADLLECVIQMKGLADTPRRLSQRVAEALAASPSNGTIARSVAAELAAAEPRFRACLDLMLAGDRPRLPVAAGGRPSDAAESIGELEQRFARARQDSVAVLERCSARDLNRVGVDPSRGSMTVADLVAVMLAHDTDQLGRLVAAAGVIGSAGW
jgi:hypothetical protein